MNTTWRPRLQLYWSTSSLIGISQHQDYESTLRNIVHARYSRFERTGATSRWQHSRRLSELSKKCITQNTAQCVFTEYDRRL